MRETRVALLALMVGCALAGVAGAAASQGGVGYWRAQAQRGALAYRANCAACHGTRLAGGAGPALRGPAFNKRARQTQMKVGDLFANIATQMPLNAPASLTRSQYVAIAAYVLAENGFTAGGRALTYAAAMRSNVPMRSP